MTLLLSQTIARGVGPIVRTLSARPAYDKRAEGYGIHGMELTFAMQRNKVRVEVLWMTGWMLPQNRTFQPMQFDGLGQVAWHLPIRTSEYESHCPNCEYLGQECYGSSASLKAGELFNKFVADPESLWTELEAILIKREKEVAEELANRRNL